MKRVIPWTLVALIGLVFRAWAEDVPVDPGRAENEYGITLAFGGEIERSEEVFTSLLTRAPGDARAFNNLGNLYLLRHELDVALAFYNRANARAADDPGILLNRATVLLLQGKGDEAEAQAAKAIEMAGGMGQAASLLGLHAGTENDKGADKTRMSKQEILGLLHDALAAVPQDSTAAKDSTALVNAAKKKHGTWRSAGARASEADDNQPVLYWKR